MTGKRSRYFASQNHFLFLRGLMPWSRLTRRFTRCQESVTKRYSRQIVVSINRDVWKDGVFWIFDRWILLRHPIPGNDDSVFPSIASAAVCVNGCAKRYSTLPARTVLIIVVTIIIIVLWRDIFVVIDRLDKK